MKHYINFMTNLPEAWRGKILRSHLGGIIAMKGRNYILDNAYTSRELAEKHGAQWESDGNWQCLIIDTQAKEGLARITPFFLLRRYVPAKERREKEKESAKKQ